MDPYFNSNDFNTISSKSLEKMTNPVERIKYVFKVYVAVSKLDEGVGMAISSENAESANKKIDNEIFNLVTEDNFTNIFCDKEGIIGVSRTSEKFLNRRERE